MTRTITLLFSLILLSTSCAQDKKDFVVTMKTSYGDMVAILYDETPQHKANFIKLAKEHYFDSTLFHRVIPNFMIQGGDPKSKNAKPGERLGTDLPIPYRQSLTRTCSMKKEHFLPPVLRIPKKLPAAVSFMWCKARCCHLRTSKI